MEAYKNIHEAIKNCPKKSIIIWDEANKYITSGYKSKEEAMMVALKSKKKRL